MAEPTNLLTWECNTLDTALRLSGADPRGVSAVSAGLSGIWNIPDSYRKPDNWSVLSGMVSAYQPNLADYTTYWTDLKLANPVSALSAISMEEIYETIIDFEKKAIVSGFQWSDEFPVVRDEMIEATHVEEIRSAIEDLSGKLICFADNTGDNVIVDVRGSWNSTVFSTKFSVDKNIYCSACYGSYDNSGHTNYSSYTG